ncbi:type II secretion system protein N [Aquabacterium sp. A08]|uniref:type II secretion system protein N n=1 Tax=Aquabacterium sp. A08 TaxID=2718532 RepID=UPI00141F99E3|nr:type II secretion system protein N [Aquabacterium sp. A08]NIC42237.1 type II secretion system protein N [Aquabacterium sp. A08]
MSAPPSTVRWPRPVATLALAWGLLAGTLVGAPAAWLAHGVAWASGGRLLLLNPHGTVWQGQAQAVAAGGRQRQHRHLIAHEIRWRLRPAWSQGPGLAWQLSLPCCATQTLEGRVLAQRTGIHLTVQGFQAHAPLDGWAALGSPWNTVRLQGRLQLSSPGLSAQWDRRQWRLQGSLNAELHHLRSALSPLPVLGNYRLRLVAPPDGPPQVALQTLSGALQLSGQAEARPAGWRFRGLAETDAAHLGALSHLLNILGRRDGLRTHITLG